MADRRPSPSPIASFRLIAAILGMLAVPAAFTLHTVRVSPAIDPAAVNPSPYGYTISLLLFILPILAISIWLVPQEGIRISKKSFLTTIALLFPLGAVLDFCFARSFLRFPNPGATLRMPAPALGGSVPVEEYVFYLTGFVAVLLIYIWLDEYWLACYSIPVNAPDRTSFARLLRFHPKSLLWGIALIAIAFVLRWLTTGSVGIPGYFLFLVAAALLPSSILFPSALPVINWRAFGLTLFIVLFISLLWEATLALPYGWWGYQDAQMIGVCVKAWSGLPIEAVCVWVAVTYQTAIVYEVVRRWQASGKLARNAFLG